MGTCPLQADKHVHWAFTVSLATKYTGALSERLQRENRFGGGGGPLSLALVHVRKAEIPENPNDLPVEIREGLESGVKASIPLPKSLKSLGSHSLPFSHVASQARNLAYLFDRRQGRTQWILFKIHIPQRS